jgi:hypothetical protein
MRNRSLPKIPYLGPDQRYNVGTGPDITRPRLLIKLRKFIRLSPSRLAINKPPENHPFGRLKRTREEPAHDYLLLLFRRLFAI